MNWYVESVLLLSEILSFSIERAPQNAHDRVAVLLSSYVSTSSGMIYVVAKKTATPWPVICL